MNCLLTLSNGVALIELQRKSKRNALSSALTDELIRLLFEVEANAEVGCTVITGYDDVFCAGADIEEMNALTFETMFSSNYFGKWEQWRFFKKPIIAAVNGMALGGGFELALLCDIIYASDNAILGFPETQIGGMPAIGGTQKLPAVVGKYLAADLILTGRRLGAEDALRHGLVSRIFKPEILIDETLTVARQLAQQSRYSLIAAKEAIDAQSGGLGQSAATLERRLFHSLFSTKDQKEGMSAFVEKRPAVFNRID